MFISHIDSIEKVEQNMGPGITGVFKQAAITPKEGWDSHVLRVITLEKGKNTARHSHPWPHINYILKGEGTIYHAGQEHPAVPGTIAHVPADEEHSFTNIGSDEFVFICIVPKEGDKG